MPKEIPREAKLKYARSLLKVLALQRQAHCLIGNHAGDGISADQRKRVTMGVEMAADPAILFLDEPTSGLDSFGAVSPHQKKSRAFLLAAASQH